MFTTGIIEVEGNFYRLWAKGTLIKLMDVTLNPKGVEVLAVVTAEYREFKDMILNTKGDKPKAYFTALFIRDLISRAPDLQRLAVMTAKRDSGVDNSGEGLPAIKEDTDYAKGVDVLKDELPELSSDLEDVPLSDKDGDFEIDDTGEIESTPKELKRKMAILIGGSCTGKTTMEKKLIELMEITPVEIFTDRSPRSDDMDHYHFLTLEEITSTSKVTEFDFMFSTEINDRTYGFVIPNGRNDCVVSFIGTEEALEFEKISAGKGFDTQIFIITVTEEEISKCMDERNMGDNERINRKDLAAKGHDTKGALKEPIKIGRENFSVLKDYFLTANLLYRSKLLKRRMGET